MPTESVAGAAIWKTWGHVFAGAFGLAITLAWMREMNTRQVVLASASGAVCILWGTPVAMAVARGYLPAETGVDVMDAIGGLTGAAMGAGGIYLVSGVMRIGERFAADPWAFIDRLRGQKEG